MEVLILIVLIAEIICLVAADRFLFGTYITPVSVLALPYLLIVFLIITFGTQLGFKPLYYPSLLVWIIGLPVFWIPGAIQATIFLRKTNIYSNPYIIQENFRMDDLIIRFSWLSILILTAGFINGIRKSGLGSVQFEQYFGSGLYGHILLVSKFFFIYILVRFKKSNILPAFFLLFYYIAYGVKGWIFIPILAAIIIRVLLVKTKVSFSLITRLLALGIIVFYIVYRIAMGPSMPISFVFMHFFRYAFAGVLGLSEYFHLAGEIKVNPLAIIDPVLNIFNKISGSELINNVMSINTYIGAEMTSNVKSFFGTIYIYAGTIWGLLFVITTGFVSYMFLIITIKTKNLLLMIVYGTYLTMLLFGWFDTYSGNLFFYEFPFFGLLMYFINPLLIRIRIR